MAYLAIEMGMHVGIVPRTDDLIFFRAASIFERMDKLLAAEKVQCSENAGLVNRLQIGLEIGQGKGLAGPEHRSEYQYAVGGRFYVVTFKKFNAALVHTAVI